MRSGRGSPKPEFASDAPPANSPVSLPASSPGGTKVDTSDSSYAAFVKQWCFAQSTPPTNPGTGSPSVSSTSASPVPTPPPPPSSLSGVGIGFGSFHNPSYAGFAQSGHNGVGARRQQAWPADYQVGAGTNMGLGGGYGFPGAFNYGQRGAQHDSMSVVGGELVF